jgi:hypothetical protein
MRIRAFSKRGLKRGSEDGRQLRHNEADEMAFIRKIPMKVGIYKNLVESALSVDNVIAHKQNVRIQESGVRIKRRLTKWRSLRRRPPDSGQAMAAKRRRAKGVGGVGPRQLINIKSRNIVKMI